MNEEHMELDYTYWDDGDGWLIGHLNVWPDNWTQGKGIEELEIMLRDLYECYKEKHAPQKEVQKRYGKLKVSA